MGKDRQYYVYIMANPGNRVLYTGVTNDLERRVFEHRNHRIAGFTARYNVIKLVYYETGSDPIGAIEREKQIKAGSRTKKIALIESMNPQWCDLAADWYD
jgi:putative endonuclease